MTAAPVAGAFAYTRASVLIQIRVVLVVRHAVALDLLLVFYLSNIVVRVGADLSVDPLFMLKQPSRGGNV